MGRSFSNGVPVMQPFFECRSIKGFHEGACANCIYFVDGHLCSFVQYSFVKKIAAAVSDRQKEFNGMPSSELVLGSFTRVGDEHDFDKAREDALGQVVGFKPRSRKAKPEERRAWE
jgi:hypothetical protein